MQQSNPVLITPGDPAGIGPEIALRTFAAGVRDIVLMGDIEHLAEVSSICDLAIKFAPYDKNVPHDICPVLEISWPADICPGSPDNRNAPAVIGAISRATSLTKQGAFCAVTTNPIAKSVLYESGFTFPGHTEFLAFLDGHERRPVMMMANDMLKAVPLTIHIPLSDVESTISAEAITRTISIMEEGLSKYFGVENPHIAITGLNPHAGESGHIGTFEQNRLAPLIDELKSQGHSLSGPHSTDSLFHEEARHRYDAVLTMYHDQALIPLKTLDFHRSVNVTLGLSFIRTSPDHGTAFDIAPHFAARPDSLIAAIKMAQQMASRRNALRSDS